MALLADCKIVQTTTSAGSIASTSGDHDCAEDSVCESDIPNGDPFSDTFTAVARYGYAFAGWRGTESYLCAGSAPTCNVDIPDSITAYDSTGYMTAEFYHEPESIYPGTIAVEYGVWSDEVSLESGGATVFADDFDGDGDRPDSVHPREVLMADFNGDGSNDFFIADHGYDVNPFPGWSNQLLLATETGYDDASDRLPYDATGFTHNAAVGDLDGDGDIDILVANNGGAFMGGAPYLLLNDGAPNFTVDKDRLPERVVNDSDYWPWASSTRLKPPSPSTWTEFRSCQDRTDSPAFPVVRLSRSAVRASIHASISSLLHPRARLPRCSGLGKAPWPISFQMYGREIPALSTTAAIGSSRRPMSAICIPVSSGFGRRSYI